MQSNMDSDTDRGTGRQVDNEWFGKAGRRNSEPAFLMVKFGGIGTPILQVYYNILFDICQVN